MNAVTVEYETVFARTRTGVRSAPHPFFFGLLEITLHHVLSASSGVLLRLIEYSFFLRPGNSYMDGAMQFRRALVARGFALFCSLGACYIFFRVSRPVFFFFSFCFHCARARVCFVCILFLVFSGWRFDAVGARVCSCLVARRPILDVLLE